MNKSLKSGALGALAILTAGTLAAGGKTPKDPVLMTVNGKNVPLSEFEYLYNKNNTQQLQPQTLDEYLDMFVTYKLKVADAEAAGIDTTAAFIKEYTGYCEELANPYMINTQFEDSLVRVAYDHYLKSVDVSHIMVPLTDKAGNAAPQIALLDSLRTLIVNGADFAELARQYSSDQSARTNGGHMGWISMGQFPYEFEDVAYNTAEGDISPVFDTRFGHHIIKAGGRRDNPGEVHVRHILKLTRGLSPEEAALKKQSIDSVYAALKAGADFAETAGKESEDPGSARNGGDLPWFSTGRMVPQFEEVAFALSDGEISEPFESPFGWHIVERLDHRAPASFEAKSDDIKKLMQRDIRQKWIADNRVARYASQFPTTPDAATAAAVSEIITASGINDSVRTVLKGFTHPAATVGNRQVTVSEVIDILPPDNIAPENAQAVYDAAFKAATDRAVMAQARENLAATNTEYRNLTGEYRDGMLLFEISNRKVWERASSDTIGVRRYFESNRDNYVWQKPHYKGYIVMTAGDSVAALAKSFLAGKSFASVDSLNAALKREFGKNARAERVVTAQGDNPIVDFVAFGGERPAPQKGRRLNDFFAFEGRIINAPEEAGDVRGLVSTDYQQQLEHDWIEELHARYPVKINKKVLKKIK